MAADAGLWVVAVDPGWTSTWGQRYWQASLNRSTRGSIIVTRQHAAAVIGRRGLGFGAGGGQVCPELTGGWARESCRPGRAIEAWAVRDWAAGRPAGSGVAA
jgi:hypothetical protein